MMQRLGSIQADAVHSVWFLTMTAPPGPLTWANVEDKRRAWVKLLRRRFGSARWFLVWRKERQRNGTPHLHGLLYWLDAPPRMTRFIRWNDAAWASVVTDDPFLRAKMRRVACRVEHVRSVQGVRWYAAKYLEKPDDDFPDPAVEGRSWGIERRDMFALVVDVRSVRLVPSEGRYVRRALAKLVAQRKDRWYVKFRSEERPIRVRPVKPIVLAKVLDRAADSLEGFSSAANVLLQVEHWRRVLSAASVSGVSCPVERIIRRRGRGHFRRRSIVKTVCDSSDGQRWVEHDVEAHSYASSLAFVSSADAERLVRAAVANAPAREHDPLPLGDDGVAPF